MSTRSEPIQKGNGSSPSWRGSSPAQRSRLETSAGLVVALGGFVGAGGLFLPGADLDRWLGLGDLNWRGALQPADVVTASFIALFVAIGLVSLWGIATGFGRGKALSVLLLALVPAVLTSYLVAAGPLFVDEFTSVDRDGIGFLAVWSGSVVAVLGSLMALIAGPSRGAG